MTTTDKNVTGTSGTNPPTACAEDTGPSALAYLRRHTSVSAPHCRASITRSSCCSVAAAKSSRFGPRQDRLVRRIGCDP